MPPFDALRLEVFGDERYTFLDDHLVATLPTVDRSDFARLVEFEWKLNFEMLDLEGRAAAMAEAMAFGHEAFEHGGVPGARWFLVGRVLQQVAGGLGYEEALAAAAAEDERVWALAAIL